MKMRPVYHILEPLLFLSLLLLHSAQESLSQMDCVFNCGKLGELYPPFTNTIDSTCAKFVINCTENEPKVQFHEQGKWYHVDYINLATRTIEIRDQDLEGHLLSNRCGLLNNFTEQAYLLTNFTQQQSPFLSINFNKIRPFFKCKPLSHPPLEFFTQFQKYNSCVDSYDLFYYDDEKRHLPLPADLPNHCTVVNLPSADPDTKWRKDNLTSFWSATFNIEWKVLPDCDKCSTNGGRCSANANNGFECQTQKVLETGVSVDENYEACQLVTTNCGRGPDIRYPFYIDGRQDSRCGYPGFSLSCNDSEPILKHSNEVYIVSEMLYEDQSIFLKRENPLTSICSPKTYRVNYNNLLFSISPADINLSLFFNCTDLHSTENARYSFGCDTDKSLATFSNDSMLKNMNDTC